MYIAWSPEDKAWIVDFPDLPGCMAHGDTLEEAIACAQDASEGWLKVGKKHGFEDVEPVYFDLEYGIDRA
jgi:predicted RNase H-like HicB family nuclease